MKLKLIKPAFTLTSIIALAGCFGGVNAPEWHPDAPRKIALPADRQAPAQPIYNRLRFANLPDPMPGEIAQGDRPVILPVVQLSIKDQSVEEVGTLLAQSARYSSYCASGIAHQKMSLEGLGTIDELAAQVAKKANVKVVVDHASREVRITANTPVQPDFADEKVTKEVTDNEHKSTN
jgi:hypothetical protein